MSNERIDLTQFEQDKLPDEIECPGDDGYCGRSLTSEGGNFFHCERCTWSGYPSDSQAILMVDELITELKRCYEEIDKLNRALSAINSSHFVKE